MAVADGRRQVKPAGAVARAKTGATLSVVDRQARSIRPGIRLAPLGESTKAPRLAAQIAADPIAPGTVADPAWTGLVDDLEGAISGLRERLDAHDRAATMPARERHDLERALDRYDEATDALERHVDGLLRKLAPRPRR